MLSPALGDGVFPFCWCIPVLQGRKANKIEKTARIQAPVKAIKDVYSRFPPPLIITVFDIVMDEASVVGIFHQGDEAQSGIPAAKGFAG